MLEKRRPVSVVIVNWRGAQNTHECIQSLLSQNWRNFELLVVDNGSENREVDSLRETFGQQIVIDEMGANLGFPAACNRAFSRAVDRGFDYVFVVNNDLRLDSNALSILFKTAETDDSIGAVVPKVYYWDRPNVIQCAGGRLFLGLGMTFHRGINVTDSAKFDREIDTEFAEASACLYRVSALKRVGFFDESLFAYWEDTDLSVRLRRMGYRLVYSPGAKAWHKVSQSAPPHTKTFLFLRNAITFVKRYSKGMRLVSAAFSILGLQAPILVVQSFSRASSYVEKRRVLVAPFQAVLWHLNKARVSDSVWKPI